MAAIEDEALPIPAGAVRPKSLTMLALRLTRLLQRFLLGDFRPPGAPLENIEIHAVIVSAAQSPWDAIKRAPGVGTITVVGGIVALGKTPIQAKSRAAARSRTGSE